MTTWYASDNPNGFVTGKVFSIDAPCVSVMAGGMGGDSLGHWHLWTDGRTDGRKMTLSKPPYRVPSMAEIVAIPWNGLKVVSTFSGAGGSCTGYRMAGYRVVWANEFVPIAQASYKANAAPDCYLDPRDVRTVQAADILKQTGLAVGELDLFDGSPPCQAFSTAGKREKGWGKERHYEHGASQKNEDLFAEYIRLLDGLKPRVFVAENVSGLVKGVAKGFFLEILAGLKGCGYNVTAKVLDAQWLGVPQTRQRVIFVGVREDIDRAPAFPKPLPYRYSVRDALPELREFKGTGLGFQNQAPSPSRPAPAVTASGQSPWNAYEVVIERETDISPYAIGREWDKLKPGETSDRYRSLVRPDSDSPCPTVTAIGGNTSAASVTHPTERRKFTIAEVKRICAFPDDFILCGSYAQQWSCLGNSVPPVMMYHIASAIRDEVLT